MVLTNFQVSVRSHTHSPEPFRSGTGPHAARKARLISPAST